MGPTRVYLYLAAQATSWQEWEDVLLWKSASHSGRPRETSLCAKAFLAKKHRLSASLCISTVPDDSLPFTASLVLLVILSLILTDQHKSKLLHSPILLFSVRAPTLPARSVRQVAKFPFDD